VDGLGESFTLATYVGANRPGSSVKVTVSAPDHSRLVLDFSDQHRVLADAGVLLCGSTGATMLREHGYTGSLIERPRLASSEGPS
jgi:hypothetical protein